MAAPHLWLRHEVKPQEHRCGLTPQIAKELLSEGYKISVEKSPVRCYPDKDYESIGCTLVETATWYDAPQDAFIVGLKELPEEDTPLKHRHIFFGHAYKNQAGWKELLLRFKKGGGALLDLEFLTNDKGRRVAAFGFMAGFAGAAVGLDSWCQQQLTPGKGLDSIVPYPNEEALIAHFKERIAAATAKAGRGPRVIVMGALGRCGGGAVELCEKVGIPSDSISRWDMAETKEGGPFPFILEHDVFVNCIYLTSKIPPFLSVDMMKQHADRRLSVVVDVSCDTTNPNNPLPFCNQYTSFLKPTFPLDIGSAPVLDIVAIDHLPTLLPKESSDRFSQDLLPTMRELRKLDSAPVWTKAMTLFKEKTALAEQ